MTGHENSQHGYSGHEPQAHRHWSDDALIEAIYGLRDVEQETAGCPQCAARWLEMRRTRARSAAAPPMAADFLAAQRQRIYERAEHPRTAWARFAWAPAVAVAAGLAIAGMFVYDSQPQAAPKPRVENTVVNDSQLYSDVYSIEQSYEPSAAAPIHELFEQDGSN